MAVYFTRVATLSDLAAKNAAQCSSVGGFICDETGHSYEWESTSTKAAASASFPQGVCPTVIIPVGNPASGRLEIILADSDVAAVQVIATTGRVPDLAKVASVSTTNITLSGEHTINGFTTSASRVLLIAQTTQSQNRVWITGSGAWTTATDADSAAELGLATVEVDATTSTLAGQRYQCPLTAAQITAGGGVGTVAIPPWVNIGTNAAAAAVAAEAAARSAADDILRGESITGGVTAPGAGYGGWGPGATVFCSQPFTATGLLQTLNFYLDYAGPVVLTLVELNDAGTSIVQLGDTLTLPNAVGGLNTVTTWNPVVTQGWYVAVQNVNHNVRYDNQAGSYLISTSQAITIASTLSNVGGVISEIGWKIITGIAAEATIRSTNDAAEVVARNAAIAVETGNREDAINAEAAARQALAGAVLSGGELNPTAAYGAWTLGNTVFCKDPFAATGPIKSIPIYMPAAGCIELALVKLIAANTFTSAIWTSGVLTLTTAAAHGVPSGSDVTISGLTSSNSVTVNGTFATASGTTGSTINIPISADPGTVGYSSGALAAGMVVGETYEYTAAAGTSVITTWHPVAAPGWYLTAYAEGGNHIRYANTVGQNSYAMLGRPGELSGAVVDYSGIVFQFGWTMTCGLVGETIASGGAAEALSAAILDQSTSTPTTVSAATALGIKKAFLVTGYSDADATAAVNNTIIPDTTPDYISAIQFVQPAWADRNGNSGYAQSNEFSGTGGAPVLTTQPYYNKMPDSTYADFVANPGPDVNHIRYEITDTGTITGERPLLIGGDAVINVVPETTFCESSNYAVEWASDNWGVNPAKNIVYAFCGGRGGEPLNHFIKGTDPYTVFMDFFAQSQTYFHSQNLSYNVQTIPYIGHENIDTAATPDAYSWAEMFKKLAHDRSGDIANLTGQQTPAYTLGVPTCVGVLQGQAQQGMLKACLEDSICCYVTPDYDIVRNTVDATHYIRSGALYLGAKIGRARAQIMGSPTYGIRGRKPDFLKPINFIYYGISKGSKVILTFQAPGVLEFAQLTLAGATGWSNKPSGANGWAPRGLNLQAKGIGSLFSSDNTTAYNQMIIGSNTVSIEFTLDHDLPSAGNGPALISISTGGCGDLYGQVVAPGINVANGGSCDLRAHSTDVYHNPADGIDYPMHHLCPLFSMIATPAPSIPFSQYPDNEDWLRMMGLV